MIIFKKIFLGWKLLFESVKHHINIENMLFLLAVILLIIAVVRQVQYQRKKNRLRVKKNSKKMMQNIVNRLGKYQCTNTLIGYVAEKISMFNQYSIQKNSEIALGILIVSTLCISTLLVLTISSSIIVWYMLLAYVVLLLIFVFILFYVFFTFVRIRFTSKLPETLKVLSSRYISTGNILKAIYISLDDFDKVVRKEMYRVYNVLNKNDKEEVKQTLKAIERLYDNQHLTLLLNLIFQAHYKGGDAVIKKQFEHTTEEILVSIENQKDLTATSRAYIIMALFVPFGIWGMEQFNCTALGETSLTFYHSPLGIGMKILLYFVTVLYIGVMLLMERTI